MLPPNTVEWPIWHDDPRRNGHGRDEPVPQRHDIELARYVEKQRACRETGPGGIDLTETASRLRALAARIGSVLFPRRERSASSAASPPGAGMDPDRTGATARAG
jgi:hypothetical protein